MKYVEALNERTGAGPEKLLFLGGGITGCPDWQKDMVRLLEGTDLVLINPRRASWPADLPQDEEAEKQIRWEHQHMLRSDAIMFWFSAATLCPIVLFELGSWLNRPKKLFVGCEPGYARTFDVKVQTKLERPALEVVSSLEDMAKQIVSWESELKAKAG